VCIYVCWDSGVEGVRVTYKIQQCERSLLSSSLFLQISKCILYVISYVHIVLHLYFTKEHYKNVITQKVRNLRGTSKR
jgi:hypothetical protein